MSENERLLCAFQGAVRWDGCRFDVPSLVITHLEPGTGFDFDDAGDAATKLWAHVLSELNGCLDDRALAGRSPFGPIFGDDGVPIEDYVIRAMPPDPPDTKAVFTTRLELVQRPIDIIDSPVGRLKLQETLPKYESCVWVTNGVVTDGVG